MSKETLIKMFESLDIDVINEFSIEYQDEEGNKITIEF